MEYLSFKSKKKRVFACSFRGGKTSQGVDIRTIQELLGHKDISTTMIYTHIVRDLNQQNLKSPLDF